MARRPRYAGPSINRIIPNLLTMLGLCAGLLAIRFAFEGRFAQAAAMIVVAGVIDGLDGRIARLLKGTSPFGAEFDSLSDFLSFGVAPALVLYLWSMQWVGHLFFLPCLVYAVAIALRLARFNAALLDDPAEPRPPPPLFTLNFFTGVPAPAAAGLVLFPLFAALALEDWGFSAAAQALRYPAVVAVFLVVVGGLAVSRLPTWNAKRIKLKPEHVLPLMLAVLAYATLLVTEPWAALALGGLLYTAVIVLSVRAYRRLAREAEEAAQNPSPSG
ncbi:MAG: phosphatidylcholine/phosphatidylserine synthase [Rhodovarius sp.]|nr:phosphatidylcholine/phosphatidylserine synthase [Rhodovarius sp.]